MGTITHRCINIADVWATWPNFKLCKIDMFKADELQQEYFLWIRPRQVYMLQIASFIKCSSSALFPCLIVIYILHINFNQQNIIKTSAPPTARLLPSLFANLHFVFTSDVTWPWSVPSWPWIPNNIWHSNHSPEMELKHIETDCFEWKHIIFSQQSVQSSSNFSLTLVYIWWIQI